MKMIGCLLGVALALCPFSLKADTWTDENGILWRYTISNGEASLGIDVSSPVSGEGTAVLKTTKGEIVVPTTLGGCPVTAIGKYAFYWCSGLTKITLPETIKTINSYAFYYATSLVEVNIPSAVTTIESYTFAYCKQLTVIALPDAVLSIKDYAFAGCSTLKGITLPSSVTALGSYVFSECTQLKEVSLPDSITRIENYLFDKCISLETIEIPSSVTYVGEHAFANCSSLIKVTNASSVKTFNGSSFLNCSQLQSFSLSATVIDIGGSTFKGCSSLILMIPETVKYIGLNALNGVPNISFAEGFTSLDAEWFGTTLSTTHTFKPVERLELPSTLATDITSEFSGLFQVKKLYIKGGYRDLPNLFACCEQVFFDPEFANEWKAHQAGWSCEGSRLSVVSTLHGGTTSEKGKEVAWGEEVSVTATAKEGYVFLGWDSDREGIEGTEETITFTMPQAPVTLVANFFPKALLEGWMDTRIDAKVDGERLMTADQAAEKTAAAIEGKVTSGELFTPAGAEAKTAEAIAQKVANKELITSESLQEMALDAPVIEVDASGTAKVGISLQKATSLSGEWQAVELAEDAASVAAGALKLSVPAEEGTAFYKFVVPARQGAQEP